MPTYVYPSTERVLFGAGELGGLAGGCNRRRLTRVLLLSTPSLEDSAVERSVRDALGHRCTTSRANAPSTYRSTRSTGSSPTAATCGLTPS